jgi:hypothetical protein
VGKEIVMSAPPIDWPGRLAGLSSLQINEVVLGSGLPRAAAIFAERVRPAQDDEAVAHLEALRAQGAWSGEVLLDLDLRLGKMSFGSSGSTITAGSGGVWVTLVGGFYNLGQGNMLLVESNTVAGSGQITNVSSVSVQPTGSLTCATSSGRTSEVIEALTRQRIIENHFSKQGTRTIFIVHRERTTAPGRILNDALQRYRRPDGYEGYPVEAAWQLEQLGWEAWPVLRDLVLAGPSECEYFLGAVVRLEGIALAERLPVLLAAARNPDSNVRSRLLELLDEMPKNLQKEVLRELTAKGRPDDSVTDRAREAELALAS